MMFCAQGKSPAGQLAAAANAAVDQVMAYARPGVKDCKRSAEWLRVGACDDRNVDVWDELCMMNEWMNGECINGLSD